MADKFKKNIDEQEGKKRSGKTWQERKLEKVNRDDYDVISRRTMDQGDFIGMLNTHDNALYQMRMNMGRSKNITFEKAQEFIERSQNIKEEINLLNAEMCQLMGWDYNPPRGFANPLVEEIINVGQKKQSKQSTTTPKEQSSVVAEIAS